MKLIDKLFLAVRTPRRYLGFAVVLVLLFSSLATGLYWWQMTASATRLRQETLSEAELRGGQIASATAHVVSELFHAVDVSAIELANRYVNDAAAFDREVKEVEERLPAGSVIQVGVVDSNGYLVYSNLGLSGRTFLGDREHVKVHVDSKEDFLFVSRPVLGRVSKQWSIQFTRPIRRHGALAGVVVISVSPTYLRNALASLTLGSDDSAAVFRLSGEYLARNLDHESSLGKRAPPDRPFLGDAAPATGTFRVISNFDGTPRIYHWQRLPNYPITVVLGLSESTFLAPVERLISLDRRNGMIGIGLLWSFAFGVAFLFKRQRKAERALAELNAELEQRVVERTAQLETANRELADFSYSISHDLRSPLRAVASFAKILEDDYGSPLGEEGRRMVRVIQQSGVRMGRLIDGLLDYLALSRKKLQPVCIDMGKLAGEAIARENPSGRTIDFKVGALPPAVGDAMLVREALSKLLSNAIRFTQLKPGARIEVGAIAGKARNTYFVRDNGAGFDMQYATKLFRVFERLHTEPEPAGSGIGLAMVKRIIERHGGRVWAEGKVGEGADFYFTLPAIEESLSGRPSA